MKIGIFGGTFDPVHIGHLRAAEEIREGFPLNRIYFVPANIPPNKRSKEITGVDVRIEMLKAAVRGNRYLSVSDVEAKRGGISYTIDTIRSYARDRDEPFFIIGMDAFLEIDTWYDYENLFYHTNFIVITRPFGTTTNGIDIFPSPAREAIRKKGEGEYEHRSGKKIYLKDVTAIGVSSTDIRRYVKDGRSIRYIVPESVKRIIIRRGLYRG
jgi:nicotinate-nucleotide adenylyltransferase